MLSFTNWKLRSIWDVIIRKQPVEHGMANNWGFDVTLQGCETNFVHNGECLMVESISMFNGKTNPIRCLSFKELQTIKIDREDVFHQDSYAKWYTAVWEGRCVLVKLFNHEALKDGMFRDIVVSTQMGMHNNVHKLIACCLETKYPVIIYELPENGTLRDRILSPKSGTKSPLEWKDRLRIAYEISYAMSYLHTGFRMPIVHRGLKASNVFLDADNTTKLSDFTFSISIPKGKKFVEDDIIMGTYGYIAPEYVSENRVAESADVYSFGMLFLLLLTGKEAYDNNWKGLNEKSVAEVLDPAIATTDEHLLMQMTKSKELALKCTTEEELRPTMVDVATELKNILLHDLIS